MKRRALVTCLEAHPLAVLRAIAACHGMEVEGATQEEMVQEVVLRLSTSEVIEALLEEMEPETRTGLEMLLAAGGQMPSHRFQRDPLGGELRVLGMGAMERVRPWEEPISSTERLYYLGLIYQDFGMIGQFRGQILFIPVELLALLPKVESSPVKFEVRPLEGIPPGVRKGTLSLTDDAFAILSDLQRRNVYPVKGRYLPPDALHRINERLVVREAAVALNRERDTQRLALLMHILRSLSLVKATHEGLLKPVTARTRKWLQVSKVRRLLALQRAWADDPTWNDLWRIPTLRPEPTGWRNDAKQARVVLLHWLGQLLPNEWYNIADFIKAIKRLDPDFQRPDGDYNSWYIRNTETGQLLRGWSQWDQVEGVLLRYFFAGPLFWLGVVDLGYLAPSDKQPFAFRLTASGASWLGHEVELPPEPERMPLIIAANGVINVPAGADDWERLHLERLSVPIEESDEPGDYRLDKEKIIALLMEGSDIERVLRFLDRATNGDLPNQVRTMLRGWAGGYGRMVLQPWVVLEVDHPQLMRDLQRQPNLSHYFERPLGPRTVAIAPGQVQEVIAALRQAGYLPRVIGGDTLEEK